VSVTDHRDLVAALLGVPGVAAAAVEPHGSGPGTLRLQLAAGADEVDVAGAVNRLLRAKFGLAVDADRVRVLEEARTMRPGPVAPVQAASETAAERGPSRAPAAASAPESPPPTTGAQPPDGQPPDGQPPVAPSAAAAAAGTEDAAPAASGGRLVIERVQLVSAKLGITVSVTLRDGARAVVGEAEGAATSSALHRSVASATLRAVEAVVDDGVRFDVEHVEIASTGEERTALVVLSMVTERGSQRLSGASVVRDDARQAVIRAVLAALNRRIGPMLAEVAR
jgi:hypothetical protein